MRKQIYAGRAVGLGLLEGETMDTLRLSYSLTPANQRTESEEHFGGYECIALINPHLRFKRAVRLLGRAMQLLKRKACKECSIVVPWKGNPKLLTLKVHLDWRVERYYNEADWISLNAKLSEPTCDMIVLFPVGLSSRAQVAALRKLRANVKRNGLPKGIVALGEDEYVTVFDTARGPDMVYD